MASEETYSLRLAGVYATRWRYRGSRTVPLEGELAKFYSKFEDQGPYQLPHLLCRSAPDLKTLGFLGVSWPSDFVTGAEVLVFSLPFPADQVVATLILTLESPDLNVSPEGVLRLFDACAEAQVIVDGCDLPGYVERLLTGVGVQPVIPPGLHQPSELPLERHQLVFIRDLNGMAPVRPDAVRRMLNGNRLHFAPPINPNGLSEDGAYGAVGTRASFLSGHSADVENSVFVTTVQAVGTASRFQQIWQEAYYRVQEFQEKKQSAEIGVQQREDMAELADRMGNLELDLAFSVQTAADLGLNPSTRVDSFHDALYEVMQVEVRARTVGEMFDRLGGSIRSELTAIESRERQEEERRRSAGGLALGILSFVIAPVTFLLGFFGMNVSQVHNGLSMWDFRYYMWVYIAAGLLATAPLLTVFALRYLAKRRLDPARRSRDPGD